MRRRLDLAAALVHRPPVLFLDEPTTGLDPQGRNELWGVIEELVRGGTTVLLTTQYLEEADTLADNIVVIDHGSVIAEGTAAELKERMGATVIEIAIPRRARHAPRADVLAPVGGVSRDGKLVRISVPGGAGPGRCSRRCACSTTSTSTRDHGLARADARRRVPRAHRPHDGRGEEGDAA